MVATGSLTPERQAVVKKMMLYLIMAFIVMLATTYLMGYLIGGQHLR